MQFDPDVLPITVLRPNNIYGTRQFPEKLIPKSIYLLSKNKKVPLHGSGNNIRHYLSVNDFLAALNVSKKLLIEFSPLRIATITDIDNLVMF